jgi:hypothetical protein
VLLPARRGPPKFVSYILGGAARRAAGCR